MGWILIFLLIVAIADDIRERRERKEKIPTTVFEKPKARERLVLERNPDLLVRYARTIARDTRYGWFYGHILCKNPHLPYDAIRILLESDERQVKEAALRVVASRELCGRGVGQDDYRLRINWLPNGATKALLEHRESAVRSAALYFLADREIVYRQMDRERPQHDFRGLSYEQVSDVFKREDSQHRSHVYRFLSERGLSGQEEVSASEILRRLQPRLAKI